LTYTTPVGSVFAPAYVWTATDVDDGVCCAREEPIPVLRQAQAEYAALVGVDYAPALVRVEAVHLHAVSFTAATRFSCRTKISPPWVPAKMYREDTARARIDLSCFMRCDRTGVPMAFGPAFSAPLVSARASWCRGTAAGMVSLVWSLAKSRRAWSRVKASRGGRKR